MAVPRATRAPSHVSEGQAVDVLTGIVDADASAFGVRRARLLERLVAGAQRLVVEPAGGFAIRWHNGFCSVVGPVVAHDDAAAIALVDAALEGCPGPVRIDVTSAAPALVAHLLDLGLGDVGSAPLMTWPNRFLPGRRGRYRAIALQAFG